MTTELNYMISKQLHALIADEPNLIAILSNASALINEQFDDINWAGFYLWDEEQDELVLGPFQGKVACVRIKNGSGVCGTAFNEERTIIVPDVHLFPGHIACDAASQSEIVVPLVKNGKKIGVLDIDAPVKDRFSEKDKEVLEELAAVLLQAII
ncbi:GAF domain-containing protein [Alkalibacterium olivapovliticus]|uniref:GAF domain-containing protein n=1 Tax=Alkalibacterium olivapovliticus TaxID=99907 RepID=A0A2T0WB57_9LACT|nr:GAF domain-containing protein [Alkalibacterium olivapovliticus]PRY83932.1 GAF domain-containing protein [Alkalibacterium olivapovliticus]